MSPSRRVAPPPAPKELEGLGHLYNDFHMIERDPSPFICIIDTTDPSEVREKAKNMEEPSKIGRLRDRIEEMTGVRCLIVHYMQITRRDLERPNVQAIVIFAWKQLKNELHKNELYAMLRETDVPTIGFCGGFHQIYLAYGGKAGAMRPLRPDESDPYPKYYPGEYKEWGPTKIRILKRDPLFEGFGDEMVMIAKHYAECKELPDDFENLATSDECRIQVIRHKARFLYGTQFHPEIYDDEHLDGRRLLINFFRMARDHRTSNVKQGG